MIVDRRAADADRADSAAVRVDQREVLRQRHSHAVRGDPGAALGYQRRRPGGARRASASCAPTARRQHEIERFRAANDEYLRRNRVLIRLQGLFYPSMTLFLGFGVAAGAVARQPRSDPRPHHARRVRRLQRVPGDAQLADDRVRLGHEHAAARHGVLEADARGARRRARDISDADT